MNWITRERPKIDRIACPWLINRFIDKQANFYFVPFSEVEKQAKILNAIPFDIPGVEFTHYGYQCTFDYFIKKYQLKDEALKTIAKIVRGADTDKHDLAAQSAGLRAIFSGLSYNIQDDNELLDIGMIVYDGLYSWAKYLKDTRHTQNQNEKLFYDLFEKFLRNKTKSKEIPYWAKEIDKILQNHIGLDTKLSLSNLAKTLNIHPAYLSREFSKYFDNLTFTEYVRKIKIDKAKLLLDTTNYSISEIAYAVGYSDQSHFTKNFKRETGIPPSVFKKRKGNP
ncbi:MAG TPA: chromate resistance protein ChrB domain-containing protein [Eudoraea sp.]|nr:chromate resistance protein ChrB domain-containing protein [Eudoraea sp.]